MTLRKSVASGPRATSLCKRNEQATQESGKKPASRSVLAGAVSIEEALDSAGTGAQEATHETFVQLDELLAELSR